MRLMRQNKICSALTENYMLIPNCYKLIIYKLYNIDYNMDTLLCNRYLYYEK